MLFVLFFVTYVQMEEKMECADLNDDDVNYDEQDEDLDDISLTSLSHDPLISSTTSIPSLIISSTATF